MTDAPAQIVGRARARARPDRSPIVVGIAGAVASGKSTFAAAVAGAATDGGATASVVTTDGFLYANAELERRGLLMHKGFPQSYDVDRLRTFVQQVHSGATEVMVPQYSHEIYDVGEDAALTLVADGIVVVEGVNALGALAGELDLGVYLHAEEADLERWYVARFLELCAEAEHDASSFYRRFAGMSPSAIESLARDTWRGVNLVNLREHIAPTRALADYVVTKGPDHSIVAIEER